MVVCSIPYCVMYAGKFCTVCDEHLYKHGKPLQIFNVLCQRLFDNKQFQSADSFQKRYDALCRRYADECIVCDEEKK